MENAARHNKLFALSAEAKSVLTLLISSVISFGSRPAKDDQEYKNKKNRKKNQPQEHK